MKMPKRRRPTRLLLTAVAALAAAVGTARGDDAPVTVPEFELGYRFVDVSGNDNEYRSQINDRPGVLLRSLNWASNGPVDGLLDYFRVNAEDLGAGPAGSLRLQAGQQDLFKLDFTWRRMNYFSALPAFANPFIDQGIIPGQHTYNRSRDIYDINLQILPGKMLTPILGYTQNVYRGPGTTTYHLGGDEFLLDQDLHAKDEEFRIGLGFDFGSIAQGQVVQGWRRFRFEDSVTLAPGANNGNVTFPILGQDVQADGITRSSENKVNTPTTSVWISSRPLPMLKLVGSYVRADASGDTNSAEIDAGNFVSFEISRFFKGLNDTISSRAETNYWRGSARAEITLAPNLNLSGGWTEKSRELTGTALATSLFIDTMTFGGISTGDLQQIARSNTSLERDDRVFDASVTANALGPFSVNAGWSQLHQNVTFGGEFGSVVEEGETPGEYTRTVNTYGGGAMFTKWGFTIGGDYRHDHGDQPILRTDYTSRDRYKVRAAYSFGFLRIGGSWRESHASDDAPEIQQHSVLRELDADLEATLLKGMLTLRASGGEFKTDRSILIRVPQNFDIAPSFQKEMGHTWGGGATLAIGAFHLNGDYLWMENQGSIPFTVNRVRALAEYFFTAHFGLEFEWLRDKYSEAPAFDQAGPLANFNANRYGVFVHWRPEP